MRLNAGRDASIVAALAAGEPCSAVAHRFDLTVSQVNRISARDSSDRRSGQGRPRQAESDVRQQEFVRLIATGTPWDEAAKSARVEARTVLRMLDRPDFRSFAAAVLADPIAA